MNAWSAGASGRSLLPLWTLIAVFALPVAAAWFFYLNPEHLPSARSNRGELIRPPIPLDAARALRDTAGRPFDADPLRGRWTLLALASPPCDRDCRETLTTLRQVRLALGEGRLSVERLLVLSGELVSEAAQTLQRDFPGLHLALADGPLPQGLGEPTGGPAAANRVFILDPLGNLMMRYPSRAPAEDLLNDMERLLKASKNWIKGAHYGHR